MIRQPCRKVCPNYRNDAPSISIEQGTITVRRRPPPTRRSITHRFVIHAEHGTVDGYITVGLYEDGTPAELFIVLGKGWGEGMRGMARCWATCFSIAIQAGVPLETLIEKFKFFLFEPAGQTNCPELPHTDSLPDYVCRWMEQRFAPRGLDSLPPDSACREQNQDASSACIPRAS